MSLFIRRDGVLGQYEIQRWSAGVMTVCDLRIGRPPASEPEQPAPSVEPTVIVDQTYTGMADDSLFISRERNGSPSSEWWMESGRPAVGIVDGVLTKASTATYHRLWNDRRIGGLGHVVRMDMIVRSDVLPQTAGSIPGLKVGPYFPRRDAADPDDPDSVNALNGSSPASFQIFTGQTEGGHIEMSNQPYGGGYRFSWQNGVPAKKVGYIDNTEQHLVVTFEQLSPTRVRGRLWTNGGEGAPLYEWDDTNSTHGETRFYWRIRTDDTTWKARWIKITDTVIGGAVTPTPGTGSLLPLIWQGDFALSLPSSLDFFQVDGSNGRAALGSMVADTRWPEGRAFQTMVNANMGDGDDGYRGITDLVKSGAFTSPQRAVQFTESFVLTELGSMATTPGKLGYGLAGAPPNSGMGAIASGGYKPDTSWSVRRVWLPANYLRWRPEYDDHPATFGAYLYVIHAGGINFTENNGYGIEFIYRNPDGSYIPMVQGKVYNQVTELVMNTPGQNNGRCTVYLDGQRVVHLTDVQFNPSAYDYGVGYFTSQTFANYNLTTRMILRQNNPRLRKIS